MKLSPWLFGFLLCFSLLRGPSAQAVDKDSADWISVGKATALSAKTPLNAINYNPQQSIAEFNRQHLARDAARQLQIAVEVPRDQLALRKLAQRAVRFEISDGVYYTGKVTSAFLSNSSSNTVLIHATVENRLEAGQWQLKPGTTGTLSIRP